MRSSPGWMNAGRRAAAIPEYAQRPAPSFSTSSDLGPRCKVWSEKELIDKCAWEFEHVHENGRRCPAPRGGSPGGT